MDGEKVKPMIPCSDYWPTRIPVGKMVAYKQMLIEGQITRPKVTYNRGTGSTLVTYKANQPHEWVLERLREIALDWE